MSATAADPVFAFDNSYQRLPDRYYARIDPTPVSAPRLIKLNHPVARLLGLDADALATPAGVACLAGNRVPAGAAPIAMAYAGHQFGGFSPQLGDGRAILLGEVVGPDGVRRDIHLKGSGPTPFSRRGDGRAALGPVLREYVVSEAMATLGIPTTRALAAVATGDTVLREGPLPGGVLTRIAESHIRVGTFQYFAARDDIEGLRLLADHVIARLYPELLKVERPYIDLVSAVARRQAALIARWMHIGFIHGVMNTDNMAISGETIDYGPCAFMDGFDPATVFSSIDHQGRYAFANQPAIAQWNLARFAETMLPLIDQDQQASIAAATAVLDRFPDDFTQAYVAGMRPKLGLSAARDSDAALFTSLLGLMRTAHADFTSTFRALADVTAEGDDERAFRQILERAPAASITAWLAEWRSRIRQEMADPAAARRLIRQSNPLYIPRNHLVEEVITAAVEQQDFAPFEALIAVLSRPFEDQPGRERYARPPRPEEVVAATFCGT
jgi:uncharacterized protein YdiU (UPF0061 family)